jgi:hypothetical protein
VREHNVAANALWPATLLKSSDDRWGLGDRSVAQAEIVADAMVALFARAATSGAGADRRGFLACRGVTDFALSPDRDGTRGSVRRWFPGRLAAAG